MENERFIGFLQRLGKGFILAGVASMVTFPPLLCVFFPMAALCYVIALWMRMGPS